MTYKAIVIDDPADPTFNQLLGISNSGRIVGYYGSGASGHPNKGYQTTGTGTTFNSENLPFSVQTQVTGVNDSGWTVGFGIDAAGNSIGFVDVNGSFVLAVDPLAPVIGGVVNEQLLGINDSGVAVGFYAKDAAGHDAGFLFNTATNKFTAVNIAGAQSVVTTSIDQAGDYAGFYVSQSGRTLGFVHMAGGKQFALVGPAGASNVQALGINDAGQVVGSYTASTGSTDGFVYNVNTGVYTTLSYGAGTQTVLNGINDRGQIVGFDVNAAGNTDGLLLLPSATPLSFTYTVLDNPLDPTFNQLLSINDAHQIVGYYGSGASGHPNKGYELNGSTYTALDFPLSVQTQQTGINNSGATSGFEIDTAGNSLGFLQQGGVYKAILDPNATNSGGLVNEQLLGLNDIGQAAGFYQNAAGNDVGFVYNANTNSFRNVAIGGATSVVATDVNDSGFVSGFYTTSLGQTLGFVQEGATTLSIAGAAGDSNIQVLGLNNNAYAVGSFTDAAGMTEGFAYQISSHAFTAFKEPNGIGGTVFNGINDMNQVTGFYTDAAGNTHGLLATPTA